MQNFDVNVTGRATLLHLITGKQDALRDLMVLETTARQQLWQAQEDQKRIEDLIAQEIWTRTDLKNDRDRNAAKHLARINDQRFINAQSMVQKKFVGLAEIQADIIIKQSELQISVVEYEYLMLGRRDALMQFAMQLARVAQPDTTMAMGVERFMRFQPHTAEPDEAMARMLRLPIEGRPADTFKCDTCQVPLVEIDGQVYHADTNCAANTGVFMNPATRQRNGSDVESDPATMDEYAAEETRKAPNGRCDTCGQPFVIAMAGIRKGKPVHGDNMTCASNAGSWMNPLHPNFLMQ